MDKDINAIRKRSKEKYKRSSFYMMFRHAESDVKTLLAEIDRRASRELATQNSQLSDGS